MIKLLLSTKKKGSTGACYALMNLENIIMRKEARHIGYMLVDFTHIKHPEQACMDPDKRLLTA
jgi:hypothetical protein